MDQLIWIGILTLALIVAASVSVSYEYGFVTLVATVLYGAALYYFDFVTLDMITDNPLVIAGAVGSYLFIGTGWMVYKWWWYCRRLLGKYRDLNAAWKSNPDGQSWDTYWRTHGGETLPPLVSRHKAMLVNALAFWPFSIIDYVFSYLLRDIFVGIYNHMAHTMQRIADEIFEGVST